MRTLVSLIVVTLTALVAVAQNYTEAQMKARNAPDLFVYSVSAFGPNKKGESSFTIEVKNTGGKTISAFEWGYYADPLLSLRSVNAEPRIRFRNDGERLQSGERKKLTSLSNQYTDELIKNFRLNRVSILKVEYEDGSVWHRSTGAGN